MSSRYPYKARALMRFKAQDGQFTLLTNQIVVVTAATDEEGDWVDVLDEAGCKGSVPAGFLVEADGSDSIDVPPANLAQAQEPPVCSVATQAAQALPCPTMAEAPRDTLDRLQETREELAETLPTVALSVGQDSSLHSRNARDLPPRTASASPSPSAPTATSLSADPYATEPAPTPAPSKTPPSPATKPNALRDRIAMFNKAPPSTASTAPPIPRSKPPLARKPIPLPVPPINSSESPAAIIPEASDASAHSTLAAGMSAADAEESVRAGGSLKDRIKLLQQQRPGPTSAEAPSTTPKVKREWKRPPAPTGEMASGLPLMMAPAPLHKASFVEKLEDLTVEASQTEETGPAVEGSNNEAEDEEEEIARRRRIAERMAKLGGAKMGFGFPGQISSSKPAAPAVAQTSSENDTFVPGGTAPLLDQSSPLLPPEKIAMPAIPKRAGPPRRRPPNSPSPSVASGEAPSTGWKLDPPHEQQPFEASADVLETLVPAPPTSDEAATFNPNHKLIAADSPPNLNQDVDFSEQLPGPPSKGSEDDFVQNAVPCSQTGDLATSSDPHVEDNPAPTTDMVCNLSASDDELEVPHAIFPRDGHLPNLEAETARGAQIPTGTPPLDPSFNHGDAQECSSEFAPVPQLTTDNQPYPSMCAVPHHDAREPVAVRQTVGDPEPAFDEVTESVSHQEDGQVAPEHPRPEIERQPRVARPPLPPTPISFNPRPPNAEQEGHLMSVSDVALLGVGSTNGRPQILPPIAPPSTTRRPSGPRQLKSPPSSLASGSEPHSSTSQSPQTFACAPETASAFEASANSSPSTSHSPCHVEESSVALPELPQQLASRPATSERKADEEVIKEAGQDTPLPEQLPSGDQEEEDETVRRRRLVERMAKMGGRSMMGPMVPMFSPASNLDRHSPAANRPPQHPAAQAQTVRDLAFSPDVSFHPPAHETTHAMQSVSSPARRAPPLPNTPAVLAEHDCSVTNVDGSPPLIPPKRPTSGAVFRGTDPQASALSSSPPPSSPPNKPRVPAGYNHKRSSVLSQSSTSWKPEREALDVVATDAASPPESVPIIAPPRQPTRVLSDVLHEAPESLGSYPPPEGKPSFSHHSGSGSFDSRRSSAYIQTKTVDPDSAVSSAAIPTSDPTAHGSYTLPRQTFKARDLDLASERWWRSKPVAPPHSVTALNDVLVRLQGSSTLHKGRSIYQYELVVIRDDYSKTVVNIKFDDNEDESGTEMSQVHHPPPESYEISALQELGQTLGPQILARAKAKEDEKGFKGEDGSSLVKMIVQSLEAALDPVGQTYGEVVYKCEIQDLKGAHPEIEIKDVIRPGDIVASYGATFKGKGIGHGSMNLGTVSNPHIAVVAEHDIKKNKFKAYGIWHGKVELTSYRLDEMKSGCIKVFRVLDKDFIWPADA